MTEKLDTFTESKVEIERNEILKLKYLKKLNLSMCLWC